MKFLKVTSIVLIGSAILLNISMTVENDKLTILSLSSIEALATEINYAVPNKNNKPEKCTLYMSVTGHYYASEGEAGAGFTVCKNAGMQNFCEDPKKGKEAMGCDPYNCHKRVG